MTEDQFNKLSAQICATRVLAVALAKLSESQEQLRQQYLREMDYASLFRASVADALGAANKDSLCGSRRSGITFHGIGLSHVLIVGCPGTPRLDGVPRRAHPETYHVVSHLMDGGGEAECPGSISKGSVEHLQERTGRSLLLSGAF